MSSFSISAAQNCRDPPEMGNASMLQTNDFTNGDVVTYHCDEGYMLASGQPNVSITCSDDGNWTEVEDACLRKLIEGYTDNHEFMSLLVMY